MPKLGMHAIRREQLIDATVTTVDELGLAGTTVARIADNAGLSAGIISHYFGSKDALLAATMRQMLHQLGEAVAAFRRAADPSPRAQLRAIIDGNFDNSQISAAAMRVWLSFWASSMHAPELARLQHVNDRRLYSNLCYQFRRVLDTEQARSAATGLAAIIDGLWLRGSLQAGGIDVACACATAYAYLDTQLAAAESHAAETR